MSSDSYFYFFMLTANTFIRRFAMQKHPEGGYYSETYRSRETVPANCLPARYSGERNYATAIYFLLEYGDFSAFHRLQSDEIWHFYSGSPLILYLIGENGNLQTITLGDVSADACIFQLTVSRNTWMAAEIKTENGYTLAGCTMAPGFSFEDFILGNRTALVQEYPQLAELITALTRK